MKGQQVSGGVLTVVLVAVVMTILVAVFLALPRGPASLLALAAVISATASLVAVLLNNSKKTD